MIDFHKALLTLWVLYLSSLSIFIIYLIKHLLILQQCINFYLILLIIEMESLDSVNYFINQLLNSAVLVFLFNLFNQEKDHIILIAEFLFKQLAILSYFTIFGVTLLLQYLIEQLFFLRKFLTHFLSHTLTKTIACKSKLFLSHCINIIFPDRY